jgi:hypothetical protein
MKKTNIIDCICNALRARTGKTTKATKATTIEIGMQRCDECDYYKKAHEPAETAETTEAAPPNRYWHEITYLDGLVLVVLYEATEDGPKELARAHGYIIHEGAEGIAQATSYAMKGIWYKVLDPFMGSGTK